jgi:hypothetical protein
MSLLVVYRSLVVPGPSVLIEITEIRPWCVVAVSEKRISAKASALQRTQARTSAKITTTGLRRTSAARERGHEPQEQPMLDAVAAPKAKHLCMRTGEEDVKYSVLWVVATILFTAISFALGFAVNGLRGIFVAAVSHGIQWVCCCFHAFPYQTEMYYDLTGSVTYISIALFTILYTAAPQSSSSWTVPHPRQVIATSLVVVWAVRLGSYLFARIQRDTKDGRFTNLKPYFVAFFGTWTIQGTWVFLTGLSVWAVNQRSPLTQPALGWLDAIGISIW